MDDQRLANEQVDVLRKIQKYESNDNNKFLKDNDESKQDKQQLNDIEISTKSTTFESTNEKDLNNESKTTENK